MKESPRTDEIIRLLSRDGAVSVAHLAQALQVS